MLKDLVTAITLSGKPVSRALPDLATLVCVQSIENCAQYNEAFYGAIAKVKTPFFFFLDDDDTLPDDYLSVLNDCLNAHAAVAYTDELRSFEGGGSVFRPGTYTQSRHLTKPTLVHHLALCRTGQAQGLLQSMPTGQYWPEMPLYFALAKDSAAYIPRVGYRWNRSSVGLSSQADFSIGQMRSKLWCLRGKS